MSHLLAGVCWFALALGFVSASRGYVNAAVAGFTAAAISGLLARAVKREGR